MASIVPRGKKYYVVYTYQDSSGVSHQKWEKLNTYEEAISRKAQVEAVSPKSRHAVARCKTLNDLLDEYLEIYGKTKWSMSTYTGNVSLIRNYIHDTIGQNRLTAITVRVLEKYYHSLLTTRAVQQYPKQKDTVHFLTPSTIRKIHTLLKSAFNQAMKWELIDKNPASIAELPKSESMERAIWDAPTLFKAIELCTNPELRMCMHLAFACSLRLGETIALTWDCVDISPESLRKGCPSIYINKTIQRITKEAAAFLDMKDILKVFPEKQAKGKTLLVMKKPKTASSVRRVYLPMTLANILVDWRKQQNQIIRMMGSEYTDYNLVIPHTLGTPLGITTIDKALKKLIRDNNLPDVVFHSLRHTSITYKLVLNGGDIKAVQGDSGHSQAQMITERYSHILEENRVTNAQLVEEAFYQHHAENLPRAKQKPSETFPQSSHTDESLVEKILGNPDVLNILRSILEAADKNEV